MIIPNLSLSDMRTSTIIRRDGNSSSKSEGSKFTGPAFYITCVLLLLILLNLLLTIVLLLQSRRIDERLKAAIAATYRRARSDSRPLSKTPIPANIPPSRPPRASFPSIHCPNEGRQSTINITELSTSQSSARTIDSMPSLHLKSSHFPKHHDSLIFGEGAETFNFLVEPVSPSSDEPITPIIP